jgi:membrane-bound metal-dependent hydrolase YbcI (DUF457 family)
MFIRTHLAITFFGILLLISSVENKIFFVIFALIATYIPDVDTAYSRIGKKKIFGFLRVFVRHRGFVHSFTFLFLAVLVLLIVYPVAAAGFFIGYGLHIFSDSFTLEGITPFYPWGKKVCGDVKTGGKTETIIFIVFVFVDLFFLIAKLGSFL